MPWTLIAYPLHAPCMILAYSLHTVLILYSWHLFLLCPQSFPSSLSFWTPILPLLRSRHLLSAGPSLALQQQHTWQPSMRRLGAPLHSLSLDSLGLTKWLDFFLELLLSSVQLLKLFTPWRKCASLHVISCNQAAQKISVFNHLVPCLLTNFCQKLDLLCQHLLFLHLASDVGHWTCLN